MPTNTHRPPAPALTRRSLVPSMDRRQFLRAAAGGSLAVMALPGLTGAALNAAARPWPMRLALSSVMFEEAPFEEVCARAAKLGFEAVDIWGPFGKCRHLDDVVQRLGPDGLRNLLAGHRLRLCSFSVYGAGFAKYARFIGRFGGGVAVRESAYGTFPADQLTSQMKAFFEKLKPVIDLAAQAKARLAIENHGNAILNTLDSIKAFVDLNPAPQHVGIALAPYHLQAIRAPVEQAIAACGTQLLFFYAWQHEPGTNQLPGHGATDFTPWLAALAKINFAGHVNPFMHGHAAPDDMSAALKKASAYLKACHAKAVR
ncbi:MAG: TIM barrel protein [Verrucomicrobia bacterium]|nr:TIM barrel protein [Verrucomicrobiota bacterium]